MRTDTQITRSTMIPGHEAIEFAEKWGLLVCKYADPQGDEAIIEPEAAREIAEEDPSLVYLDLEEWYWSEGLEMAAAIAEYRSRTDLQWLQPLADAIEEDLYKWMGERQRLYLRGIQHYRTVREEA